MDWGVAARFTLIIVAIFAAAILAIFVFDAVWAKVGLGAAIVVLIGALYAVKRWSARNARRTREKWERSS
jgi:Flp pilus assembly protein TadB